MTLFKFPLNTVSVNKIEVTRSSDRITDFLLLAEIAFQFRVGKLELIGGNIINLERLIFRRRC